MKEIIKNIDKRNEVINELNTLKLHLINIGDTDTNPNAIDVLNDAINELTKYNIL